MEVIKKIKMDNKPKLKDFFLSSYLISQRISPYVSALYINKGIIPNKITLHMIYSGIIGAILFSIPNIYLKIFGAIFIHLWFVLDCSDGEVARYTRTFSKYGKELDFVAHLINHPLFGLSMFFSMLQLERYNNYYLIIIFLISNTLDYLYRNIETLNIVINLKDISNNLIDKKPFKWTNKKKVIFISAIFTVYPNFILFGVIIYFIDYFIGLNILYIYVILNVILTGLFLIIELFKLTQKFYKSN